MATNIPADLRYTSEHEWARLDGDVLTVGITDYAQDALGEVTFIELPAVGAVVEANGTFGTIESVKTFSDLFAPVAGEILEVNQEVLDDPARVNEDPYAAWLVRLRVTDAAQLDALLDAAAYEALTNA
jgi:glycine cleavage system H protein